MAVACLSLSSDRDHKFWSWHWAFFPVPAYLWLVDIQRTPDPFVFFRIGFHHARKKLLAGYCKIL
eukprot:scaffold2375_cov110-Cylindrotheca_fusiformis.AAC.2